MSDANQTPEKCLPPAEREPGLYLTLRLDHVTTRVDNRYGYTTAQTVKHTETLAEATGQRFSKGVMASLLRAIANEIDPQPKPF